MSFICSFITSAQRDELMTWIHSNVNVSKSYSTSHKESHEGQTFSFEFLRGTTFTFEGIQGGIIVIEDDFQERSVCIQGQEFEDVATLMKLTFG